MDRSCKNDRFILSGDLLTKVISLCVCVCVCVCVCSNLFLTNSLQILRSTLKIQRTHTDRNVTR